MWTRDPLTAPRDEAGVISLASGAAVRDTVFGRRAWKLARLTALGLPVPAGIALSFDVVGALAGGGPFPELPGADIPGRLLAVRSSPGQRSWGGIDSIRNLGIGEAILPELAARLGAAAAFGLYRQAVRDLALLVHGVELGAPDAPEAGADPDTAPDEDPARARRRLDATLAQYADATGTPFPQDPAEQLEAAIRAMARRWNAPSARILRAAKGAPEEAGLGLIVQEMVTASATGALQLVDSRTGVPGVFGTVSRARPGAARPGAAPGGAPEQDIAALGQADPGALARLRDAAERTTDALGDAFRLDFALEGGKAFVIDALPVRRTARAAVRIAVDLARRGAIGRNDALLRVEPRSLIEHLHPQIHPAAARDVFETGLAASPGAATGRIVFTSEDAQAAAAQDHPAILVRVETTPEDIRGMHSARGVLTIRGGMTSHAAVIARGIGLPCVVGAGGLILDSTARTLTAKDGRVFPEGTVITLDGTRGEVMSGAPDMIAPELGGAFSELLGWADDVRDLGVRANADTPAEARAARDFRADGLGLCRTEHMFFDEDRVGAMRAMILADSEAARIAALSRLLPMQRADFTELFGIMRGLPVTIRLLDLPLHEFLPSSPEQLRDFAISVDLEPSEVARRVRSLSEVNPMLGMRGVRLGLMMPEIYAMQARAIFEAAIAVNAGSSAPVVPEIMLPMVSANREVEMLKERIEAVAAAVASETGTQPAYRLGVMLETPRAALRAGDLARSTAFLSFGTNDLTQMAYGLSRDDSGRFMRDYVTQGIYTEDPFHSLDVEGVGELMLIAARRGRNRNPSIVLGLCGEHGGDPSSIRFCKLAGFDYVSCSPFRVPIARLAAAQATILAAGEAPGSGPVA